MPKQVDGFSKDTSRSDEITYSHDDDDTLVKAAENADGTWSVTAFPSRVDGSVEVAKALGGRDAALDAMVAYMTRYTPEGAGSDPRASARPQGGMADEMMQDDGGDGLLARASEAGQRIASKAADTASSALEPSDNGDADGGLFDSADRDGPTALERFSEDRDRGGSSPLFDDTMRGGDGPGVFDEMGRDGGPSVFDEMGRDRGGPSAFEKLSDDDRGRESRLDRLRNAEDSGDLYGGR